MADPKASLQPSLPISIGPQFPTLPTPPFGLPFSLSDVLPTAAGGRVTRFTSHRGRALHPVWVIAQTRQQDFPLLRDRCSRESLFRPSPRVRPPTTCAGLDPTPALLRDALVPTLSARKPEFFAVSYMPGVSSRFRLFEVSLKRNRIQ